MQLIWRIHQMSPYLLRSPGAFASFYWRYFAQTVVKNTTNHRHHRNEGIYINKLSMISLYSPFRMSIRLLTIMALQLALAHPRFLYLTLSKQLYIPGSRYSTVFIEHDLTTLEDSLLDIGIVFSLNQSTPTQSNTIFDVLESADSSFLNCYGNNYMALLTAYSSHEPCQQVCNFSVNVLETQKVLSFQRDLMDRRHKNEQTTLIVDNTFYPCQGGSYVPQLYLEQSISITIQENKSYLLTIKLIFVFLLQFLFIAIAYFIIMFRKYRKLRSSIEKMKSQQDAQQLLNSFMTNERQE